MLRSAGAESDLEDILATAERVLKGLELRHAQLARAGMEGHT